ncbi:MAG: LysM peptidoglycan-binding domain-containing protein [Neisseriaceae bacterium]|nr:LysM peptidoglycan-binding domain-containing protein [Neisseriaceae bacterium]
MRTLFSLKTHAIAVSLLFNAYAYASLGNVNVNSSLGDPFNGRVLLTGVGDDDLQSLKIELSSDSAPLKWAVRPTNDGVFLDITSSQPMTEPFVRFVIVAETASGRSSREYTVLLDHKDYANTARNNEPFSASRNQAYQSLSPDYIDPPKPNTLPKVKKIRYFKAKTLNNKSKPSKTSSHPDLSASRYTVIKGDYLYGIAKNYQVKGSNVNQVAQAIFRANPKSFVRNNPNFILAGTRLVIPGKFAQGDSSHVQQPKLETNSLIVEPKVEQKVESKVQQETEENPVLASIPMTEQEMQPSLELTAPTSNNTASESIIEAASEIEASKPTPLPIPKPVNKIDAMIPDESGKLVPNPNYIAPSVESSEDFMTLINDNMTTFAGGAALLAAMLGGLLLWRRRSTKSVEDESSYSEQPAYKEVTSFNLRSQSQANQNNTILSEFTHLGQEQFTIQAGVIDPIAEADVYIGYGRTDQAEAVLKDAIKTDSLNAQYYLKLLDIFTKERNLAKFEHYLPGLYELTSGEGTAWNQAIVWGDILGSKHQFFWTGSEFSMPVEPVSQTKETGLNLNSFDPEILETKVTDYVSVSNNVSFDLQNLNASSDKNPASSSIDFDFDSFMATTQSDLKKNASDSLLEKESVLTEPFEMSLDDPRISLAKVYIEIGDKEKAKEILSKLLDEAAGSTKSYIKNLIQEIS